MLFGAHVITVAPRDFLSSSQSNQFLIVINIKVSQILKVFAPGSVNFQVLRSWKR